MIKPSLLLVSVLLVYSIASFAQQVTGVVKEESSRIPVVNALVITSQATLSTNAQGAFTLSQAKIGDRIAIRHMGYETVEITIKKRTATIFVYLRPNAIVLREIRINTRNHQRDSLNIRKEYASAFAYKGPSFTDMFIERDPNYNSPAAFVNPRSTASIISLNVLQVINLMGKKKKHNTKLKDFLIREEELNYLDNRFSKEKVRSIVNLEDDELVQFMNSYRPSDASLKKMTAYELTLYIKKSYEEFKKKSQIQ
jgi:hypothetical protein